MSKIVILLAAVAMAAMGCGTSSKTKELSRDVVSQPGHGADKDSLFRSANLAKALEALKSKAGSQKLLLFKIESASLKTMVTDGKTATNIIVTKEFNATDIGGVGVTTGDPFAVDAVGSDVPEQIVAALSKKGVTLKDVDYFTVLGSGSKPTMELFTLNNKGIYQANLDGSNVHTLGSLPTGTGSGGSSSKSAGSSGGGSTANPAAALGDCIAKAGTDAAAIQKCATGG
jgi:hypothetical protein